MESDVVVKFTLLEDGERRASSMARSVESVDGGGHDRIGVWRLPELNGIFAKVLLDQPLKLGLWESDWRLLHGARPRFPLERRSGKGRNASRAASSGEGTAQFKAAQGTQG